MAEDHKYIKKEWKNGKWQYYYEDKVTGDRGYLPNADAARAKNNMLKARDAHKRMAQQKKEEIQRKKVEKKISDLKKEANKKINTGKDFVNGLVNFYTEKPTNKDNVENQYVHNKKPKTESKPQPKYISKDQSYKNSLRRQGIHYISDEQKTANNMKRMGLSYASDLDKAKNKVRRENANANKAVIRKTTTPTIGSDPRQYLTNKVESAKEEASRQIRSTVNSAKKEASRQIRSTVNSVKREVSEPIRSTVNSAKKEASRQIRSTVNSVKSEVPEPVKSTVKSVQREARVESKRRAVDRANMQKKAAKQYKKNIRTIKKEAKKSIDRGRKYLSKLFG